MWLKRLSEGNRELSFSLLVVLSSIRSMGQDPPDRNDHLMTLKCLKLAGICGIGAVQLYLIPCKPFADRHEGEFSHLSMSRRELPTSNQDTHNPVFSEGIAVDPKAGTGLTARDLGQLADNIR